MKIAIRGGHSLDVGGAHGILNEVTIDRIITALVIWFLKLAGHEVLDVTPTYSGTSAVDLTTAVNKAKAWGAEIFISIHLNAYGGGSHGVEVIYDDRTKAMSDRIVASIASLGFYSRGDYADRRGLYEFNSTPDLANLIVECFFVDNQGDVDLYKKVGPDAIARKIAEGILGQSIAVASAPAPAASGVTYPTGANYNPYVLDVQRIVNKMGIAALKEDGKAGPLTMEAFKKICVRRGDKNALVTWIQKMLNVSADGVYGNAPYHQTYDAIVAYQRKQGLVVDAIVGRETILNMCGVK